MTAPYVNFYTSEMPGAPTLSGAIGGMLPVLDACLADGWGLVTATSLVVSGEVATLTFASGPVAAVRATIEVAGITGALAALNGKHRVTSVSSNTAVFAAPGAADGTATGTITMKIAGSGWEKAFTGTNKRAYRSLDVSSTRLYLRVDDTATLNARWRGYEVMTDVDTGTGDFPTVAQQAAPGLWAHKANNTSGTRKWILIADSKRFWLLVQYHATYTSDYAPLFFGDGRSYKAADAYLCMIAAPSGDNVVVAAVGGNGNTHVTQNGSSSGRFVARGYAQTGGSLAVMTRAPVLAESGTPFSGDSAFSAGPDPVNNALYVSPLIIRDGTVGTAPIRGSVPGFLFAAQNLGTGYSSGSFVDGQDDLAGRELVCAGFYSSAYPSTSGLRYLVDITGPWG